MGIPPVVQKVRELIGVSSTGQANKAGSVPVVIASDDDVQAKLDNLSNLDNLTDILQALSDILSQMTAGQATQANSQPVTLASDDDVMTKLDTISNGTSTALLYGREAVSEYYTNTQVTHTPGAASRYFSVQAREGDALLVINDTDAAGDGILGTPGLLRGFLLKQDEVYKFPCAPSTDISLASSDGTNVLITIQELSS